MKESQWKRCLKAMLKGETVSWLWGAKQNPPIADALRRCRELKDRLPTLIRKQRVETDNSHYVGYFMDHHQIALFKKHLKNQ